MRKAQDNRIESAGYEGDSGESSYWIYLSPGYIWQDEVHFIHETTKRDALSQMDGVSPCRCQECLDLLAGQ